MAGQHAVSDLEKSLSCDVCGVVPGEAIYLCTAAGEKGQHSICSSCMAEKAKCPRLAQQTPPQPEEKPAAASTFRPTQSIFGQSPYEVPWSAGIPTASSGSIFAPTATAAAAGNDGRCRTVRNTALERAIAASGIPVSCKFAKADGCPFRGSVGEMADHVANCPFRKVHCILIGCHEFAIRADQIVDHLKQAHSVAEVQELTANPMSWPVEIPAGNDKDGGGKAKDNWRVRCFTAEGLNFAAIFGKCVIKSTSYHTWVVGLFGPRTAKDIKLTIRAGKVTNGVTWESKVFTPDPKPTAIMGDPLSLELPVKQVSHMAAQKEGVLSIDIGYSVQKV